MKKIEALINEKIKNIHSVFIFPSEVAADFWRKEALRTAGLTGIRSDRFLSWDRFKENSFALFRREKPVNAIVRTVFAHRLLSENRQHKEQLRGIIGPGYEDNSNAFRNYLVRILPTLKTVADRISGSSDARKHDPVLTDLVTIYHLYIKFLSGHGLFEPGYEVPDLSSIDNDTYIIFPELIEDYAKTKETLKGHPKVKIVSSDDGVDFTSVFKIYPDTVTELEALFSAISKLLYEGVRQSDIAVTAADGETSFYLRDLGEQYSVPLDFREGSPITDYPVGRFFTLLKECGENLFHIDTVKELLLSSGVPWNNRDVLESFILRIIESGAAVDSESGQKGKSRFAAVLNFSDLQEEREIWLRIKKGIDKIVSAEDPAKLLQGAAAFSSVFFSQERWDDTNRAAFEFALHTITEIDTALRGLSLPEGLSLYDLFLQVLQTKMYVPRNRQGGIPVYQYRVSAGIRPKYHFIVSAHLEGSRVLRGEGVFLRKDLQQVLGLGEIDCSRDFLSLYAESGDNVVISCSEETYSGKTLVPVPVMEAFGGIPPLADAGEDALPFHREKMYWKGDINSTPRFLYPLQLEGAETVLDLLNGPESVNFTADPIQDPGLRKRIMETFVRKREDGSPFLSISPTALSLFAICPFSFLFNLLIPEEEEYRCSYLSPLLMGTYLHEVLYKVYSPLKEKRKSITALSFPQFKDAVEKGIDSVLKKTGYRGMLFLSPVKDELSEKGRRYLLPLYGLEEKHFNALPLLELEKPLSVPAPVSLDGLPYECLFRGRIDRISGTEDDAVIIDYKKKNRVKKREITGSESEGPSSFQMPMYFYLAEQEGLAVSRCGYLSLADTKYVPVLKTEEDKKGWIQRDELEGAVELMIAAAKRLVFSIVKGDYRVQDQDCISCRFRPVCRTKYMID